MNKVFSIILTGLMIFGIGAKAQAVVIVDQSAYYDTGRVSQVFPDSPSYDSFEFDDFDTVTNYYIDSLSIYGSDNGNSAYNAAIIGEIWNNLPGSYGGSLLMSSISGTQVGGNLLLDFGGQLLPAGNDYWITAYVNRPFSGGGQWFWNATGFVVNGSQSYFYNPGNGFGMGSQPIPGSSLFTNSDMAFKLEGRDASAVPEPASLLLMGAGLIGAFLQRKFIA